MDFDCLVFYLMEEREKCPISKLEMGNMNLKIQKAKSLKINFSIQYLKGNYY